MTKSGNTLIQVTRYGMGEGDTELSLKLVSNYFNLLLVENKLPKIIAFYNGGVQLLTAGSSTFDILTRIADKGVQLIGSKTCMDFYGIEFSDIIGSSANMIDIISLQSQADKVITL